jgi:hypothetical protein
LTDRRATTHWHDDLWKRRPDLFDVSAPFASRIWTLGDGWRGVVETLCERLAEVAAAEAGGHLRVSRMENIRAVLNVEWQATSSRPKFEEAIGGIVALASARCACTCETCGQPARGYRSGGHVVAACTAHMPRGSAEITPPWPLIRIVRDFVDGRSQIVVCQLYDRDLDRFGDVSPAELGIDDFR